MYDLTGWDYSDELLGAAGLPRDSLPRDRPLDHDPRRTHRRSGRQTRPAADRESSLRRRGQFVHGAGCAQHIAEGRVYASLGSSAWIAVSSEQPLLDDRTKPYVFTHVIPGMFTSAVAIFSSGTSFRWIRDHLCRGLVLAAERDGADAYELMTALAAQSPVGSNKLLFNPSLAGGSSLEASPDIRGALLGLDLGHTQADVVRAAMEGIALNLRLVLDVLRGLCTVSDQLTAVGGSSQSRLWRQILADALKIQIVKTNIGQEAGSLGAAAVAAVGAGLWSGFDRIDQVHRVEDVAEPLDGNMRSSTRNCCPSSVKPRMTKPGWATCCRGWSGSPDDARMARADRQLFPLRTAPAIDLGR